MVVERAWHLRDTGGVGGWPGSLGPDQEVEGGRGRGEANRGFRQATGEFGDAGTGAGAGIGTGRGCRMPHGWDPEAQIP